MKKGIIIGLVILMAFGLATKMVSAIDPLAPEWIRVWGNQWRDEGWDVIKHGDYLYVTGSTQASSTNMNLFLRKYDLGGNLIWEKTWDNGPQNVGFVLGADGSHLYVGGYTKVGNLNRALFQKWDLDGNLIWTRTWGMISKGHHEIDGIAIVGDYIYVSHWDATWRFQNVNAVLKKFDKDGNMIWSIVWGTQESKFDSTDGHIYADATGIWICGRIEGTFLNEGNGDAYLTKIAPDGAQLWLKKWGGSKYEQALNLSSDGNHIYLSGQTYSFGAGKADAFLLKYDLEGNLIWSKIRGGPQIDFSRGISAADKDYVYMSMYTQSYGKSQGDTMLLRYRKSDGTLVGEKIWGDTGDDCLATSLFLDESYVYMIGRTTSLGAGGRDAILMKVKKY